MTNTINNLKKVSFLLIILIVLLTLDHGSYAANVELRTKSSSQFVNFINKAYSNTSKLNVLNQQGEDVTNYFVQKTKGLFDKGDYVSIERLISNEKLLPSIEESINARNDNELMASRTVYYSDIITNSYNLQGQIQRWDVLLGGTITYNPNTGEIYSASNPSLSIYDDSGVHYNLFISLSDVETSRDILSSKVLFKAKYHLKVWVYGTVPGTDLVPLTGQDFGIYRPQFYAYPE